MSKSILIVDDSKISRRMIGDIIKKLGYEVAGERENGKEGFEAYKELNPDIVLSDIEMPVLDGYGMVKEILSFDPEAKVIMITSVVNAMIIQKIKSAGAKSILTKPINKERIEKALSEISI